MGWQSLDDVFAAVIHLCKRGCRCIQYVDFARHDARLRIDAANTRAAHTRCNYNVSHDERACIRERGIPGKSRRIGVGGSAMEKFDE